jgi:hypothetical protein
MTGTDTADAVEEIVVGGVDSHADTIHVGVVTTDFAGVMSSW